MSIVPKLEIITRYVHRPYHPDEPFTLYEGTEAVVVSGQVIVIKGPARYATQDALVELLKATETLLANNPRLLRGMSDGEGRQFCGAVFNQKCLNGRIDYSE